MKAAGRPGADATLAPLLAMLERDRDPLVRARAATALSGWHDGPLGVTVARRVQHALSREQNLTVRWHLAWTLRRAYPKRTAAYTIRAGLRGPDELVRIQFADLVGRRENRAGLALLRPLLADPSWRVREQALESIRVLRGLPRTEHLKAIPAGVVTPPPVPPSRAVALAAPSGLGTPRRPTAADARLDLPLRPVTAALMDGPMPGPHPRVRIGTTEGPIVVRLYPEWAPLTVANFLGLVERRYYDGLRWFRIVPDFVVQTGDPTNTGDGDAGYTIPAEENPLEQTSGVISMGLNYTNGKKPAPIRDSAGTQFYITISPQLHLDRDFTVFGRIESGFPVLGRLTERDRMTRVVRIADD
ncbi:MAG TPA: peptidylprolyl isomerase [Candidatus Baltobacteraceae bacterium]|nr:peptidylprolyl isomerase [Candidatus Baltobacteraceae bacterium]